MVSLCYCQGCGEARLSGRGFRAKITAVLVALQFALAFRLQVRVWSDCLGVVRKVRRLVQGFRVGPTSRNADRWRRVSNALVALGDDFQGILKIEARVEFAACDDEVLRGMLQQHAGGPGGRSGQFAEGRDFLATLGSSL